MYICYMFLIKVEKVNIITHNNFSDRLIDLCAHLFMLTFSSSTISTVGTKLGNWLHALCELYHIPACRIGLGLVMYAFFGEIVNFMLPCWDGEQFEQSGAILVNYMRHVQYIL